MSKIQSLFDAIHYIYTQGKPIPVILGQETKDEKVEEVQYRGEAG